MRGLPQIPFIIRELDAARINPDVQDPLSVTGVHRVDVEGESEKGTAHLTETATTTTSIMASRTFQIYFTVPSRTLPEIVVTNDGFWHHFSTDSVAPSQITHLEMDVRPHLS